MANFWQIKGVKIILETEEENFYLPGLIYQEKLEGGRRLLFFKKEAFFPELVRDLGEIIEISETEGSFIRLPSGISLAPFGSPGEDLLILKAQGVFGSGFHPTTKLCLEMIDALTPLSGWALDLGSGSGILALVLAKKGWRRVVAVDIDQQAVKVIRQNVKQNRLEKEIFPLLGDIRALKGPFELVVANLYLRILVPEAQQIKRLLARKGRLILSGFLASSVPAVKNAYQGLKLEQIKTYQGWAALSFVTP